MKLVLHNYWRSSASHRVRIGLALKQLAYDYVAVDILHHGQHADAYRAKNPMAQVPTLEITEDDGTVHAITQSLPILEYVDERFSGSGRAPLLPRDLYLRARARGLAELINSGIQPLQNRNVTLYLSQDAEVQKKWLHHFVSRGLESFEAAMASLEAEGVRGPFAYGEAPGAADVFLVPQVVSAQRFAVDVHAYPRVLRAFEAAMKLEAFQKAAPERQPDAVKKG